MPWNELRGHDRVLANLRQILARNRLPHAFLFTGPEGIGKHSFARLFAQSLLCDREDSTSLDPCDACESCTQVRAGTHPDLVLARKPEDRHDLPIQVIRDLCHDLSLKPLKGNRRVAILDDADDLNEEASNAFLKTLEEPPTGSVLILVGSAPELQLDTIVSRCRVIRFEPLSEADLTAVLIERGLADSAVGARRYAHQSEGSVSRALALAEPGLERVRRELIDELASKQGLFAPALARRMETYSKEAGKESVDQRSRARVMVGELARFFRSVLWQTAGEEPPAADPADRQAILDLAYRLEPEDVFLLADRCLVADWHIQRMVYLPLVFEGLAADLERTLRSRPRD